MTWAAVIGAAGSVASAYLTKDDGGGEGKGGQDSGYGGIFKSIGGLMGGPGGGEGGAKVSQSVNTNNSQSAVLSTATNISVLSPGDVGPASTNPSSLIYPASQSNTSNQQTSPAAQYPTLPSYNLPVSYTPALNRTAATTSGFQLTPEILMIGAGLFLFMGMGKGKG